jgi:Fe-S cluster assembly protein SufD
MNFAGRAETQFKQLIAGVAGGEKTFRQEAWDRYAQLGLPARKSEAWKYTTLNTANWDAWDLSPNTAVPVGASTLPAVANQLISTWGQEFSLVLTVNGALRADLSTLDSRYMLPLDFDALKLNYADGWSGLASALARPGFALDIPSGERVEKPVLIVHAQTSASSWSPSVNHIRLGAGASLELAEIHVGVDAPYLRSEMVLCELGVGASLSWARIQQEEVSPMHFSEVQARLAADASLNLTQLHGGSAWCRSSLRAEILGERASAHLSGLTFARGRQHIDQRVEVRHAKGFSESAQLFKGVLKDFARGVLNGKILIERDAQKVSSIQMNHNLLLSPTAEANTKPELEIYADDVKANHGASIGRLDEAKVFYLMSRGISRALAQQMLAHAFVGDVLMKISSLPLRRFADACVKSWLPEFSAGMENSIDSSKADS